MTSPSVPETVTSPKHERLHHDDFIRQHRPRPARRHDFGAPADRPHEGLDFSAERLMPERQARHGRTGDALASQVLAGLEGQAHLTDPKPMLHPSWEHVDSLTDAIGRLGPLAGRRVLEVGAGGGSLAVCLAQQGAEVVAIDVSPDIVEVAAGRARLEGVADRTTFVHGSIETFDPVAAGLPYRRFDAIIGNMVMAHFEWDPALGNLGRLLAPGALAVFCEPVVFRPRIVRTLRKLRLAGWRAPLSPLPAERFLDRADIATLRRWFRHVAWTPHRPLGGLRNSAHLSDPPQHRLAITDRALLARLPFTARLCRVAVIELGLPRSSGDRQEMSAT